MNKEIVMKRENRVRKNQEFDKIISKRNVVNVPGFCLYWDKNNTRSIKIGISVSKKIGNSVIRHKCKRQINEMIRKICELSDGYDIIIIAKQKFLDQDFCTNYEYLEKAYKIIKGK